MTGISRRRLLRTGAASVVVLGAAGGLWASRQISVEAREPWKAAAEGFGDARLDALAYAILAPSPHNMQPWFVRLKGDDEFALHVDRTRLLPHTDPPARQITIAFGCFVELFRQAAAERGFATQVIPFPQGEPQPVLDQRPIATVRLLKDEAVAPEPLFVTTLRRHTQRAAYDTQRQVGESSLASVVAAATDGVLAAGSINPQRRDVLRKLTAEAWVTEWENGPTRAETVTVTQIGKQAVTRRPWGISLDGPVLSALGAVGLLTRDAMDTPGTPAYETGLKDYLHACETAMAHVWTTTETNTRQDQLYAGASWVRMHQAATREGLSFHPLSQALQEFPAMAQHYTDVHQLLAKPGHTVQMLVRLGYGTEAGPSPREPLVSKMIQA